MTENERLKSLQKILNFTSQVQFAQKLGIQQGSLSDIYRAKDGIKVSDSIKRILDKDFSINIDWLETGKGGIFKDIQSHANSISGNNNILSNGIGNNISIGELNKCEREVEILKVTVEHLEDKLKEKERMLTEKERLIQVLLKK